MLLLWLRRPIRQPAKESPCVRVAIRPYLWLAHHHRNHHQYAIDIGEMEPRIGFTSNLIQLEPPAKGSLAMRSAPRSARALPEFWPVCRLYATGAEIDRPLSRSITISTPFAPITQRAAPPDSYQSYQAGIEQLEPECGSTGL